MRVGYKDGVNMRANPIRFVRKSGGPPETVASKELRLSTSVVSIGRSGPKDVVDFKSRSRDDRVVGASHLLAVTAVISMVRAEEACIEVNSRSGSRLSSLALQSANSLLSPLGSHLGLQGQQLVAVEGN